jgi:hypothetical protein
MDSTLLDEWLDELRRRRWTFTYFPRRDQPMMVTAIFWHRVPVVDVVALFRADDTALAYRAPVPADQEDPFAAPHVTWVFAGEPVWAVRGVLALPAPGARGEPFYLQPAPPLCRAVADLATRARVVRPPSNGQPAFGDTRQIPHAPDARRPETVAGGHH